MPPRIAPAFASARLGAAAAGESGNAGIVQPDAGEIEERPGSVAVAA
ncbi:hypothetical protein ACWPM1_09800 [Tsuneonella sp. HG249]